MLNNSDNSMLSFENDLSGIVSLLKSGWKNEQSAPATLFIPEENEMFLLSGPTPIGQIEVHSVREDTIDALPHYVRQGYTIAVEPFDIGKGTCAVLQDASGNRLCIVETRRKPNPPTLRH
jgi:hypothetical protein